MKYRKGYKYQLVDTIAFPVTNLPTIGIETEYILLGYGMLQIKQGYAWDGPSGPTIDTKTYMRAALAHDALYQLIRMGKLPASYRIIADKLLRQMCRDDGMSSFRASYTYWAVRTFGGASAIPGDVKEVFEV